MPTIRMTWMMVEARNGLSRPAILSVREHSPVLGWSKQCLLEEERGLTKHKGSTDKILV